MKQKRAIAVGDEVMIVNRLHGHQFDIGEVVTIIAVDGAEDFDAVNEKMEQWYIREDEFEREK